MKLRVEEITAEEGTASFCAEPEPINERLDAGRVHDFRLKGALAVDARYYRAGSDLYFGGRIRGRFEGVCARCLEAFPLDLDRETAFVLARRREIEAEKELSADDLALSFYEGEEIDLDPLFAEQALLALPSRALCREDCRGLCPHCGGNRNQRECECGERDLDPRLAVLRALAAERPS